MKIAVIAYEPLYTFIKQVLNDNQFDNIELTFFLANDTVGILPLFESVKDNFHGFLTSGESLNFNIYSKYSPSDYFIEAISIDSLGLAKLLLKICMENNLNSFKRVLFDFVHNEQGFNMVKDMINSPDFFHIPFNEANNPTSVTNFKDIETFLQHTYKNAINNGSIDMAITRYSAFLPKLKEMHIKYYFLYPSSEHIVDTLNKVITRINIANYSLTSPAVIQVALPSIYKSVSTTELEIKLLNLKSLLLQYSTNCGGDFIVTESFNNFEIYTTIKTVHNITDKLSVCNLSCFLYENNIKDINICYGLGRDTHEARSNSLIALQRTKPLSNRSCYYVNGEYYILAQKQMKNEKNLPLYQQISNETKISLSTIIKIAAISEDIEVTAKSLSERLDVTVRSANRFLTVLETFKYAQKIKSTSDTGKGRPKDVFKINFNK